MLLEREKKLPTVKLMMVPIGVLNFIYQRGKKQDSLVSVVGAKASVSFWVHIVPGTSQVPVVWPLTHLLTPKPLNPSGLINENGRLINENGCLVLI